MPEIIVMSFVVIQTLSEIYVMPGTLHSVVFFRTSFIIQALCVYVGILYVQGQTTPYHVVRSGAKSFIYDSPIAPLLL